MDWVKIGSVGPGNMALMELMRQHLTEHHGPKLDCYHLHTSSDTVGMWCNDCGARLEPIVIPAKPEVCERCNTTGFAESATAYAWVFCPWCGLKLKGGR